MPDKSGQKSLLGTEKIYGLWTWPLAAGRSIGACKRGGFGHFLYGSRELLAGTDIKNIEVHNFATWSAQSVLLLWYKRLFAYFNL
jgi:hypothetical protein